MIMPYLYATMDDFSDDFSPVDSDTVEESGSRPERELARALEEADVRPLDADVEIARIGAYHSYSALLERWQAIARRPGVRLMHIGESVGGTPLFGFRIGSEDARLASVVLAGIHPIEWIGVETGLAAIERLAAASPDDRLILAFPLLNVDGYRQVEADLRAGRRRWRRSNRNGVDLNRNWPTHFKKRARILGRFLKGYNHGGPHPLSEPEIAAVVATLERAEAEADVRIDVAVSMHSIGRMLLTPYGGVWRQPRDAALLMRAARSVQARIGEPYRIRQSSRWVPGAFAHGIEIDHLYTRFGATALLVECSGGGFQVRDPGSWLHPFRWFNPPNPGQVADDLARALEPFLRGRLAP